LKKTNPNWNHRCPIYRTKKVQPTQGGEGERGKLRKVGARLAKDSRGLAKRNRPGGANETHDEFSAPLPRDPQGGGSMTEVLITLSFSMAYIGFGGLLMFKLLGVKSVPSRIDSK
jgi:hypothetical protein